MDDKNNIIDTDDGLREVPILGFGYNLYQEIFKLTEMKRNKDLDETCSKVYRGVHDIVRDIDDEYKVKSITKTSTVLHELGFTTFKNSFTSAEFKKLEHHAKEYKTLRTKYALGMCDLEDFENTKGRMEMPAKKFKQSLEINMRGIKEQKTMHYFKTNSIVEALDFFEDFGFNKGAANELMILFALLNSEFVLKVGGNDTIKTITNSVIESFRNIIKDDN